VSMAIGKTALFHRLENAPKSLIQIFLLPSPIQIKYFLYL